MGAGRFVVRRVAANQLELELAGELAERTLRDCEAEVRAQLSVAKPGAVRAIVELRAVEGYSFEARDALVALQRHLGAKAGQTAYLADTSAGRGLALWVMHMAEGQVIKCFARRAEADAWLAGSAGPTTGVRPVVRARDPERARPRKKKAIG